MRFAAMCLLSAVALVCSCDGDGSMLPKSGGRPYEVLVTGGGDAAVAAVAGTLSAAAPGLPQREPLFDVSTAGASRFNSTAKLARSIVIVSVDSALFTATRIRYEKNVWARPQMVAYVNAASDSALLADLPRVGPRLVSLLTRAELNAAMARLGDALGDKRSRLLADMFGFALRLPPDMKSAKRGKGFVWFSDNDAAAMQNICVYSYPGLSLDPVRASAMRDSVMKANIPGECDGMYMQTAAGTVTAGTAEEKGRRMMIARGLWEMHGDAMGGPFVSHSVVDSAHGRIIVAEAFVYAPGMKKRNLIRQLEAALYTMRKVKR